MRKITIRHGRLGRYDDVSPFLVTDNKLELSITLPHFNGEFYLVTDNNGKCERKLIPAEGTVVLEDLTAGELKAEVKHYLRGDLVERYKVEPLLLKAVDKSLLATPEIAFLTEQSELQGKEITAIKQSEEKALEAMREGFKAIIDEQHRRDVAFLAFAYSEYENNVQLNAKSLSVEQFIETLGYDLEEFTDEEIEKIKTFKETL